MVMDKFHPKTVKIVSISIQSVIDNLKLAFVGKVRKYNFMLARAEAIRRSEIENRKIYVIQEGPIKWRVFSTAEVRHLKKIGVFKKDLSFKEMSEKSAFVAFPKGGEELRIVTNG